MPMIAINSEVVSPPRMPPSARVTVPIPPDRLLACARICSKLTSRPWPRAQALSAASWRSMMAGNCAASCEMVEPANQPSQAMNSNVRMRTIPTRQPRPIGMNLPSRRAPPSIIAANTIAPNSASSALDR